MALIGFIINNGVSTKQERCADTRECDNSLRVVLDPIHPSVSPCLQIEIDKSNEIFTDFTGLMSHCAQQPLYTSMIRDPARILSGTRSVERVLFSQDILGEHLAGELAIPHHNTDQKQS